MIHRVVVDMDGVLVQQVAGSCRLHNKPWPYTENKQYPWKLAPLLGLTEEECWGGDGLGYDFWRNLEPYPHMLELLGLLEVRFGAENICILSAPIIKHGCIDGKRDWIAEHLPDYVWRCMFGWSKQFCAGPNTALIDDKTDNIKKFDEAGGHGVLFPRPWNARFGQNGIEVVKTWLESLL